MRTLLILLCCAYVNAQTLCDSLSYSVSDSSILTVIGVNSSSDSLNFRWGVCDNTACYSAIGDTASFPLVHPLDTVKICYDISPQWSCSDCQYVVLIEGSWQIINIITHVNEIQALPINGKIYDLLGRELKYIPTGKMYIRNGRLYK